MPDGSFGIEMPIVDRLPFPRKYKPKQSVILLVVLAALFGLWLRSQSQKSLQDKIIIHSVNIDEFGSNFVQLSFEIQNKDSKDQQVMLLARISDENDDEIASKLFQITLRAKSKGTRSHTLDKMSRAIKDGERPQRATLQLYQR